MDQARPNDLAKMTAGSLSRNARIVITIDAILMALLWFVWSPLLFVWHSEHAGALTMLLLVLGLSTRGFRKKLASEVASDPVSFRRFNYAVAKWLCLAVVTGQIAVAVTLRTMFVWIISPIFIVIAGALLMHEWAELREAEQKGPSCGN